MTMEQLEERVKNIDERTKSIEQILPTLATKDDVREEGERTRQHFNAVAERVEASVKGIAEGHEATKAHVDTQLNEVKKTLSSHDSRIMKLEADSMKRRR